MHKEQPTLKDFIEVLSTLTTSAEDIARVLTECDEGSGSRIAIEIAGHSVGFDVLSELFWEDLQSVGVIPRGLGFDDLDQSVGVSIAREGAVFMRLLRKSRKLKVVDGLRPPLDMSRPFQAAAIVVLRSLDDDCAQHKALESLQQRIEGWAEDITS